MCLIIAVMLAVFAFNAFAGGNIPLGAGALFGSLFFVVLMIRNIVRTKKERAEKNLPKEDK